jgi:hypothetical protein
MSRCCSSRVQFSVQEIARQVSEELWRCVSLNYEREASFVVSYIQRTLECVRSVVNQLPAHDFRSLIIDCMARDDAGGNRIGNTRSII